MSYFLSSSWRVAHISTKMEKFATITGEKSPLRSKPLNAKCPVSNSYGERCSNCLHLITVCPSDSDQTSRQFSAWRQSDSRASQSRGLRRDSSARPRSCLPSSESLPLAPPPLWGHECRSLPAGSAEELWHS